MDWKSVFRHSSVIDDLVEERIPLWRAQEARRLLLRQGRKRFGEPDAATVAALEAITDLDRLERMSDAVLDAPGWTELLATQ